ASSGNVYLYDCGNCKCNAKAERTGFSGQSDCIVPNGGATAAGLTGIKYGSKTTCAFYSDDNCQNEYQSAGVYSSQTWGCTAGDQRIQSIRCWFN
ncbi:hypothetical protein BDD12DRAFT_673993, partial [Trichophaea hybrida]